MTQAYLPHRSILTSEDEELMDQIDRDAELIEALAKGYDKGNPDSDVEVERAIADKVEGEMIEGSGYAIQSLANCVVEDGVIPADSADEELSLEDKSAKAAYKTAFASALSNELGRLYVDCEILRTGRAHSDGIATKSLKVGSAAAKLIPGIGKYISAGLDVAKFISKKSDDIKTKEKASAILSISGAREMDRGPAASFFSKLSLMMAEIYSSQLEESLSKGPKSGALARIAEAYDKYVPGAEEKTEERKADKIQHFAKNLKNAICAVMTSDEFKAVVKEASAISINGVANPEIEKKLLTHIVSDIVCAERRDTLKAKFLDRLGFSSKVIVSASAEDSEIKQRLGFRGDQLVLDDISQEQAKQYLEAFKGMSLSATAGFAYREEDFAKSVRREADAASRMPKSASRGADEGSYSLESLEAADKLEAEEATDSYGLESGSKVKAILAKGKKDSSKGFVDRLEKEEEFQKAGGVDSPHR
jgi:hypothetical protein